MPGVACANQRNKCIHASCPNRIFFVAFKHGFLSFPGPAGYLCRYGGQHCPDGKICRITKEGNTASPERRRCVFPDERKQTAFYGDRFKGRAAT